MRDGLTIMLCGCVGVEGRQDVAREVANRVNSAFLVNTTEVTKKFYQCFRKEHEKFVKGIINVAGKKEINKRLSGIRKMLDDQLYASSGSLKKKDGWLRDTQPFHWYTEFYPIMHDRGGFDVIIGNPPYVEYNESTFDYTVSPVSYITTTDLPMDKFISFPPGAFV